MSHEQFISDHILLYSQTQKILKIFSYNVNMTKNVRISDEAYELIAREGAVQGMSNITALDFLLKIGNLKDREVPQKDMLRSYIHKIIYGYEASEKKSCTRDEIVTTLYEINKNGDYKRWTTGYKKTRSAFSNMIDNALKYLISKGRIKRTSTGMYKSIKNPNQ
jgi:hypothetical protein